MRAGILLIHGVGCGGDVWDRMAASFREAGFEVRAPTAARSGKGEASWRAKWWTR